MKQFKDLSPEEMHKLVNAPIEQVEEYKTLTSVESIGGIHPEHSQWMDRDTTAFIPERIYRIKHKPLSINWDHVHPDYNWMAKDKNGSYFLFENKPNLGEIEWSGLGWTSCHVFASFQDSDIDWKDSLVRRPE